MQEKFIPYLKYSSLLKSKKDNRFYKFVDTANGKNFVLCQLPEIKNGTTEMYNRIDICDLSEEHQIVENIADLIAWYEPCNTIKMFDINSQTYIEFPELKEMLIVSKDNVDEQFGLVQIMRNGSDEYHIYVFTKEWSKIERGGYHIHEFRDMMERNNLKLIGLEEYIKSLCKD